MLEQSDYTTRGPGLFWEGLQVAARLPRAAVTQTRKTYSLARNTNNFIGCTAEAGGARGETAPGGGQKHHYPPGLPPSAFSQPVS
ncbi:hypothetical protein E2C01_062721 [Portunus trituberculatus]|uniref:Uncharacterized protein n=1 Tax=Portunus trituberculatus TaxID=210409 RepID=A0A5B7HFG8_PORTR|nr:hypothetical protein [Portunus trituberculatus]